MNLNTGPIKNWFGFSRRERRSTFILLIIIVLIIGFRFLYPDSKFVIKDVTGSVLSAESISSLSMQDNPPSHRGNAYESPKISQDELKKSLRSGFTSGKNFKSSNTSSGFHLPEKRTQKELTDVNLCDSASLVCLPGIGPVLSSRIIKYRRLLGGFARIEQLKEVYGLPEETFELIKGRIYADSNAVIRININSAGFKELSRIRYLEKYEISSIMKYREIKGRINDIRDLTDNKLITVDKATKIRPYLKFTD